MSETEWEYGCVRCQSYHGESDGPVYKEHILHQSKHGLRQRPKSGWGADVKKGAFDMTTDPFAWLVDLLISEWGEPRVQPPAEPQGRSAYRSEVDGLIWVRLHDCSRRAFVWFPGGQNHNLAIDKGSIWKIRMGGLFQRAELETHHGTWAGLTRETVEPVARWVYGIKGN